MLGVQWCIASLYMCAAIKIRNGAFEKCAIMFTLNNAFPLTFTDIFIHVVEERQELLSL
jgi:hypothetical protein